MVEQAWPATAGFDERDRVKPMSKPEFERIAALARERFGLDLRSGKEDLVSARLGKRLRSTKFRSFGEYYEYLIADRSGEEMRNLINSLTTNHTSFFREPAHFEYLNESILGGGPVSPPFRIWSAGCSTGEEPYSILVSIAEAGGAAHLSGVQILATDISSKVLAIAARGIYPEDRFRGVPRSVLSRCLLRGTGKHAGYYRVKPHLAARVEFRWLNLIDPFPSLPPFDVIFCRNVMIYFNRETQQRVVNRLADCLAPGGHLLVGHAESLSGVRHVLEYVKPSIYRRKVRR